jgi:hypothetical protein
MQLYKPFFFFIPIYFTSLGTLVGKIIGNTRLRRHNDHLDLHSCHSLPMSARYAPIPNPHTDTLLNDEMEAAFEAEDEEEEEQHTESHPLNPTSTSSTPVPHSPPTPGIYDFENFDYASLPPPGSPPRPSSSSLPNDIGNSNGFIPSPSDVRPVDTPRSNWLRKKARSLLPNSIVHRLHLDYDSTASGIVGGGTNNDGVFANVSAKPSRQVQLRNGACLILISPLSLPSPFCAHPQPSHQVTMFTSFRKSHRRTHHPLTLQPRPTPSHSTGKRQSTHHHHLTR